jgi:hypothetical protein
MGIPKFEVSIAGTGVFTGNLEVKTKWTYWVIHRPDGTSQSQGQGAIMTKDGREMATPKAGQKEKHCSITVKKNIN